MRRSKAEIYLHLAWATAPREPIMIPEIERAVHRCIESEAKRLGCDVLAIGGMPDHVHLLVKIPTRLSAANLAHQVKGVSSHFVHDHLTGLQHFQWQEGYAVFSVCRSHVRRVMDYVANQKQHHASGKVWASLEQTDEEREEQSSHYER